MESLRFKETNSNLVLQINKLIEESMLFFSREEYDLTLLRLKKARKLAEQTER